MKVGTASVLFTDTIPNIMHSLCKAHTGISVNICELINESDYNVMQKMDTS